MSTVHFYCVHCGATLEASPETSGGLVKCPACTRNVPVPRALEMAGDFGQYAHILPPDVLELLVKFRCSSCDTILYADARAEGRDVVCSHCGSHTPIPLWSTGDHTVLPARGGHWAGMARARVAAPTLSEDELDFLRGARTHKPEAAA